MSGSRDTNGRVDYPSSSSSSSSSSSASSSSSSSSLPPALHAAKDAVADAVEETIPFSRFHLHIPPHLHSMTAGAGAGLVSSIVTCPLDVVKTTLQAQSVKKGSPDYEGLNKIVQRIWRTAGFKGFYRGLGPTLAGYLPTWGIYFTVYDAVKDSFGKWAAQGETPNRHTAATHLVAAVTAGATGTIFTNPLWVVRTRFMAQAGQPPNEQLYKSTIGAIATIVRTEGPRALYKGLLPSLMGVSHVAVQFPLYEQAKTWADGNTGDHSALSPTTILACSAFSKMIASLATYPHEVLRTRLQIVRNHTSSTSAAAVSGDRIRRAGPGVIDTFLSIKRQDGWVGFYRGLSINLVRTVPNSAVTMLTYELIMRSLATIGPKSSSSSSSSS